VPCVAKIALQRDRWHWLDAVGYCAGVGYYDGPFTRLTTRRAEPANARRSAPLPYSESSEGLMAKRQSKTEPKWTDVKAKLAALERTQFLELIQDLYTANKDNQTFLHARFGLGGDVLESYKKTINRWLWPDVFLRQDTSISKAKHAISDYKKAVGDPAGLAELMAFYCERAAGFCTEYGGDDEGYYGSLVRMFEQALKAANTLPVPSREALIGRLDRVRVTGHEFGYGIGEDMDFLWAKYTEGAD